MTVAQWKQAQETLREKLIIAPLDPLPRYVAGVDCAFGEDRKTIYCAAVVYDRVERQQVDFVSIRQAVSAPYIPGYLSFREGPAIHAALDKLQHEYGVILFDGQGIAHPRRVGVATHVGVEREVPTIGVAKSRLVGTYAEPANKAGAWSPLMDEAATIGAVLRTRVDVKPLFVSPGHRTDLPTAIATVLACRTKYRLPEPTRLADLAVGLAKRKG